MSTRILLRRDTSQNWVTNNPILLSGEIGIETDTLKFKIGNGSRWNEITAYAFNPGVAGGLAQLGQDGKINLSNIPSAVALDSDVLELITTAINNISTSDIEEGNRLYYTDQRAVDANAQIILDAISQASSDATAKANQAQTNAINTASNDATQKVSTSIANFASSLSTSNIAEGTNLYFTDARVHAAISTGLSTSNIPEGTRLYFTNARAISANNSKFNDVYAAINTNIDLLRSEIAGSYVTQSSLNNTLDSNGYIQDSDRNQPLGFAGLNSSSKVLESVIPDSIARVASPTFTGNTSVNNLEISGNLTFTGNATQINSENITVADSIIYLADSQFTSDILDIGIYGAYGVSGHDTEADHYHTGLFRDATDKKWKLISGGTEPSSNIIDLTNVTYDTLKIGALESDSASIGNVTNTEIQYLAGTTGVIQDQLDTISTSVSNLSSNISDSLNAKAPLVSPAFTGTVDLSGATVVGISQLPSQQDNSGKFLTTDGSTSSWANIDLTSYLTTSSASAIYLTQSDAQSIYQKKITYGTNVNPPSGGSAGDVYIQY